MEKLGLVQPVILQSTCNRGNLVFKLINKSGPHAEEDVVKHVQENFANVCGIVYCFSTKDTVELAYIFKSKGVSCVYYHGQLDYFERTDNARAWLSGKAQVICATSAFGMGIDKPDVRFVIHLSLPRSLLDMAQVLLLEFSFLKRFFSKFWSFHDRVDHFKKPSLPVCFECCFA